MFLKVKWDPEGRFSLNMRCSERPWAYILATRHHFSNRQEFLDM